MDYKVSGYILILVCVILLISACIISNDVLLTHLELELKNPMATYEAKFFNARFLHSVSPDVLEDHSEWKDAVEELNESEQEKLVFRLDYGKDGKISDDKSENETDLKEEIFPVGDNELYLLLYLLLSILLGIHFIGRFFTTPSSSQIQQVHLSTVLGVGFGLTIVLMFLLAEIYGLLGFIDPIMFYVGPFLGNIILFMLVARYMKTRGASIYYEAGITKTNLRKAILVGVAGYFAFLPIQVVLNSQGMILSYLLGFVPDGHPFVRDFLDTQSLATQLIIAFLVLFSAPFFEEIFFRGIFLQSLEQRIHPAIACIFTGILFGIIHPGFISRFLVSFLGIYLAFLMQKTRSIITPIVVHFMFNANALLQLLIK